MTDKLKGNRLGSSESRDDGHGRKGFVVARGVSVVGTAEATRPDLGGSLTVRGFIQFGVSARRPVGVPGVPPRWPASPPGIRPLWDFSSESRV